MVTIHREAGFRFVIYVDDHQPAHVHVIGDGECKIAIQGNLNRPRLMGNKGMREADIRGALRIVDANREAFLARWESIHGV